MENPKVRSREARLRLGRGFSRDELRKAGATLDEAKRKGLPVDKRRRSCREENVKVVRRLIAERQEAAKLGEQPAKPQGG